MGSQVGASLLCPGAFIPDWEPLSSLTSWVTWPTAMLHSFSSSYLKALLVSCLLRWPRLTISALSINLIITPVSTCVRFCAQWMSQAMSPPRNLMGKVFLCCLFYRCGNRGSERSSNLPGVTQHPSLLLKTSLCCVHFVFFHAMQPGFEFGLCSF